jgi:hypothetical protein
VKSPCLIGRIGFHNGEFETCPIWVPGMNMGRQFAPIIMKTIRINGFDHKANWVA